MPIEITGQTQDLLQGISFVVEIDGTRIGFSECSGLSKEADIAEYREGNDPSLRMRKVTGLIKDDRLVLKRGVAQDKTLANWFAEVEVLGPKAPINPRRNLMVHTINRQGVIKRTHSVVRALPAKYEEDDRVASDSKILIETLEIEHEGQWVSQNPGKFQASPTLT